MGDVAHKARFDSFFWTEYIQEVIAMSERKSKALVPEISAPEGDVGAHADHDANKPTPMSPEAFNALADALFEAMLKNLNYNVKNGVDTP